MMLTHHSAHVDPPAKQYSESPKYKALLKLYNNSIPQLSLECKIIKSAAVRSFQLQTNKSILPKNHFWVVDHIPRNFFSSKFA